MRPSQGLEYLLHMNATTRPSSASPLLPDRPLVFRYLDARKYLADAFEYAKGFSPALSHRYVAKAMDASSSGFFKDILNGRIRISPARAAKFAKLFKLSSDETLYFETLVLYTQADTSEEKDRLLTRLSAGGSGRNNVLKAFQLEYFQKWHYAAVRELLAVQAVRDTEEDADRIAALLDPPLEPAQVRDALRLLLKLKLIRKNAQGLLERADAVIRSGRDQDPATIKPAIRGNIELALRALETQPAAVRPFSYLTVSVSGSSIGIIRDRIAALRQEILDITTRDEGVDRLYQVNLQMFPLTRLAEESRTAAPIRSAKSATYEGDVSKKVKVKNKAATAVKSAKMKVAADSDSAKEATFTRSARATKTAPGGQS